MHTSPFARPYVVSWNLTYRCNLACEHCYLDAGGTPLVGTENFADRSELGTEECFRVIDEIAAFAPECLTILTGGEPLLRRDILEIVRRAAERELWVVVGTNGVRITENLARRLAEAGARGLSLSLDALDPDRHDRFRKVRGAWRNTVEGAEILSRTGLPFIVQTTAGSHNLGELEAIADFAHDRLAAKVWNLYFLVPTGRGQFVSDITPAQYDEVLASLYRIQRKYDRRMLVNAKCAPHYIKTVLENALRPGSGQALRPGSGQAGGETDPIPTDADWAKTPGMSPIRTYSGGAGGCPAGTHYMGIRPNGDVTPCPYLPVFAGSLRSASLADLWTSSGLFTDIRRRTSLGGRCGECEMNAHCGGCRARAYGMTGDLMAEDPLCTHTPGKFAGSPLLTLVSAPQAGVPAARSVRGGVEVGVPAARSVRGGVEVGVPAARSVRGGVEVGVPATLRQAQGRPEQCRGTSDGDGGSGLIIEYGPESPATIAWDDAAAARMKKIPAFVRGMVVRAVEESCRKSGLDRVTVEELDRIRSRMPTPKIFG
jgi:radical SAM protein with 4Fe4S-binding SPASM domain